MSMPKNEIRNFQAYKEHLGNHNSIFQVHTYFCLLHKLQNFILLFRKDGATVVFIQPPTTPLEDECNTPDTFARVYLTTFQSFIVIE